MRQLNVLAAVSALIWTLCVAYAAAQGQGATVSASPQNQTVWSGVYTEAQAYRGEKVADTTCIGCHGPKLDGGDSGPKLVGQEFLANWSSQSMAVMFDWIREAMPAEAPGTMSRDDTAAVIAYILQLNKIPSGKVDLPTDPQLLGRIVVADKPSDRQ